MRCGGFQKISNLTQEHDDIVGKVRQEIKDKIERTEDYPYFKIVEGHQQVVAGLNYIFKILVDLETQECLWIKIYQSLDGVLSLSQVGKNREEV